MSDGTTAGSADPDATTPDDEAGHRAAIEQYQQDRQEREQEFQAALSKKERLERARETATITATLYGEPIEFTRLDGETIEWLEDLGQQFQGIDEEDELTDEQMETYREVRAETPRLLADHSTDADLDAAFWGDFEPDLRQALLMELRQQQSEETEQQISFRE